MQASNQATNQGKSAGNEPREKLLRIGVIQDKAVVEERFVRSAGDVTVGTGPNNVVRLPNGSQVPVSNKLFETRGNGRYTIVFERGMDGRVDLAGQPETFAELAQTGKAKKRGSQYVIDLPENARGKVVFGNVVVLFQFVDAPSSDRTALTSVLKSGLLYKIDWPYRYIIAAVFMVMGGSGLSTHVWWKITGQYYHHTFANEEERYRDLTVEMAPEKKKKKEQTVKVDSPVHVAEKPAEAKAAEPTKQNKPAGGNKTKDRGGPVTRESRRAKISEGLQQKTFLGALGTGIGDGRPVVHDANLASAFGGFDENSGVAQTGGAGAGGPEAAGGGGDGGRYKTLSQNDVGGGRIETATAKTEDKTADSEVKIKANVRDGAVSGQEGTGTINKDSVAKVFARRKGAIKYCYENALRIDGNLHGKVTIRFTIGPAGRITAISASGNTTGNAQVADCIIDKVQGWRFDPPENGSVTFSYPFLLDTK